MTRDLIRSISERNDVRLTASLCENAEHFVESASTVALGHNVKMFSTRIELPSALLRLPKQTSDFLRFVQSNNVQVIFAVMHHPFCPFVFSALRRQDRRVILVVHDATPHPGDSFPFWAVLFRSQLRSTDGIMVMSETVAETMHRHYAYPKQRTFFMPLPAPHFGSSRSVRVAPMSRPWRLLFFGRILRYKGLELLSDAYQILKKQFNVSLRIVGRGDSRALDRLALDPSVSIEQGWIPEEAVPSVLEDADILVLPYVEASQSGVLMSGFAAGLPAVATPVGGLTEQVRSGHNGLLARAVTAEAVAEAIAALMSEPELYSRCSSGAIASTTGEFSVSRAADAIVHASCAVRDMPPR
jgi:glycosyltransferase involved in cell wall biosynthesis